MPWRQEPLLVSYVNEYQHWTFPRHRHKRFVSLNGLFPEVESQQPQMENDFSKQIFLHDFTCVLYATTYVISLYLVQSTREVRMLDFCVWARLVKRTDGRCLCRSLSDLWLCNNWINATLDMWGGRADSFPLVSHICASELGPRNGSALLKVMDGYLFGAKPLPKVILTHCQLHTWE